MAGRWKKKASQFWYVLRKNFLLQWRRPVSTALEILCPLIAILALILIRHTVPQLQVKRQCFITFDSDHLIVPYTGNYTIYYAPNTTQAQNVSNIIQAKLPGSTLIATETEEMVVTRIQEGTDARDRGCFINGTGIIFNNLEDNELSYTLRLRHDTPTRALGANKWYTHIRIPGLQPTGPRVYDNAYLNEGFLHLEHVVGMALIEWTTGSKPDLPPIAVRQLPYPGFDDDEFLANIDFILPFLLMAAFLVSAGFLTKELVLEKETRMREMMKMMGLNHWILWITWYLKQFLFLLLPFVLLGVLLWGGQIFPKSNAAALVLFMIVFLLSLISFCFLISVWFDDSRLGLMAGFIFWFLTYFPHLFLAFYYDTLPLYVKIVSCLLSNTCMGLAVNVISLLELRGDGLQFSNYGSPLSLDDQFSMLVITVMLLIDAIIYLLIAWYINEIKPGQYGIPRKPYFIFQPSYWTGRPYSCCKRGAVCPSSKESTDNPDEEQEDIDGSEASVHELIAPEPPPGIEVTNLLKKFKPRLYSRQAVEVVNIRKLKIYKGQITALLGHNGAGKTTTMSILTGLFPPTSGSVTINGHSVQDDIDRIRRDLGVCPQVNVLFDRMTINEHLWYFAKLKNIEGSEIPGVVEDMLLKMDLKKYQHKRVLELSGGNKRKLSVAIAMIGDPSVVILDEPTSGMDNAARELTWTLLKQNAIKNKTTILVSTHSIDDTEMADRIVIMVHGKIRCSGRPPFLKEKYRVGYNLRVHLSDAAESQTLENTVKKHIKQYWLYSFVQHHEYTLPYDEMKNFPMLFAALEAKKWELGIISYSMQENSMEDVFINSKEGRLVPDRKYEGKRIQTSVHNPSTLPLSPSLLSIPSSPSLLDFAQSSSELEELFQSAPKEIFTIAEESAIDSSSSNHSALEEIDCPTPAQDVPLGFPAVDQSYNARQYYKSSSSGLWLQRSQQNKMPVSPLTKQTLSSSYVGAQRPNQSQSSSSTISTSNEEKRLGVSLKRSTRALERSRPLIGRPSILNSIPGLEEESEEEEEEEEMEGLWAQEAQQAAQEAQQAAQEARQAAQEEVDFGREAYDMQRLISSSSDSSLRKCNPLRDYTRLWLQQYRAMFLKRWYNFKRFLPALVWQLLIPLLFMVLGLVLSVVIHSPHRFDPSREMSMQLSAPSQTIRLFWAQYKQIDSLPFSFKDLRDSLYGVSDVENYTQRVLDLRENEVRLTKEVRDCCTYEYQLLDKFCATKTKSEIKEECSSIEDFGYHVCLDRCTSCCEASRHQLPSCSNPRFQQLCSVGCSPNVSQFCPTPPKLSVEDYENPEGPLDDINTFIADYILRQADSDTASYYQNFLGGFTIADEEPAYSVCGCEDDEETCQASLRQVELMNRGIELEESPPVPAVPVFCDDNITTLTEALGINASLSSSSNTTLAQPPMVPTGVPIPTASPNTLLSMLPSCQSMDDKTAFCLDVSCQSGGQCNTSSNQTLASQYGTSSRNSSQKRPSITVWYNNQPYHVSPSILNMLHNLYLRGQKNYSNHTITLFNHPLPRMPTGTLEAVEADLISFVVGAASILGASFLLASFSTFLVQEKSSKAKHLQMTSGLHLNAYWLANLSADMLMSLLFAILSLIIFLIFQNSVPAYSGVSLLAILILLLLLCWSSAPLVYLISLPFQNIYTAYTIVLITFVMTTFLCLALLYILGILAGLRDEADIFYYLFIFHPGFSFSAALSDLYISYVYQEACSQSQLARDMCAASGLDYMATPFQLERPGCGAIMIVLAVEGFVFFFATIILDHWNHISQLVQSRRVKNTRIPSTIPTHVEFQFTRPGSGRLPRSVSTMSRAYLETIHDERAEVEEILTQDTIDPQYTVVVYDMVMDYSAGRCCNSSREPSSTMPAVNGLTFKVEEGECFGLLGVNGAGKTTTFKILTGDISMTSGTAVIAGYDIRTQLRQVQQRIGYCPQFDALIERLTGRELLTMFARLRGIREKDIKREVDDKIERLQLRQHADKECWKYSGGNKRKLSTAIALIGDTKVIFLDEPTSGMDIDTRRKFILTLQNLVKEENRSIVLTSHSMTECEALCNRIGIMVNGQFKCIGSKEVLKDQYGENFTKLMIRVQPQSSPANSRYPSVEEVDTSASHRPTSQRPRSANRLTNIQRSISRQGQRILNFTRGRQTRTARSREEVDSGEDTPVNRVQRAVLSTFCERIADQDPIDTQRDSITFQLPKNSVPLSEIFQVMERLHNDPSLSIVGYSVSQSTLNQVFNQIVKGRQQNQQDPTHQ